MTIVGTTAEATLAQQLLPRRGWLESAAVRDTLLVIAGGLFVALCAQIRIVLPFTPVPLTMQTFGVLLAGAALGTRLAPLSMLLYILMGLVGLPFFNGGQSGWQVIAGATGGYLVAFPIAAALAGRLAERGWDRRFWSAVAVMLLGNLIIYALGVGWLATRIGFADAVLKGALPFIVGDLLKIALAALALPGAWRLLGTGK